MKYAEYVDQFPTDCIHDSETASECSRCHGIRTQLTQGYLSELSMNLRGIRADRLRLALKSPRPARDRRVSAAHLGTLLFIAFYYDTDCARRIVAYPEHRLREEADASVNGQGDTDRTRVLQWLTNSTVCAKRALDALRDTQPRVQVNKIVASALMKRASDVNTLTKADPGAQLTWAAIHLNHVDSIITGPDTDALFYVLESIRLGRGVGDPQRYSDVCDQCAFMDAQIGPLDPDCPLCEAVKHPYPLTPMYQPRATGQIVPTMLLTDTLIRVSQPDADMHKLLL